MPTKNIDRFHAEMVSSARFLPPSGMKRLSIVALWCLTTAVSILSAEPSSESTAVADVSVIAGPWMLLGEDHVVRCGIEISGIIDASAVSLHRAGQMVVAKVAVRPFHVANRPASAVSMEPLAITGNCTPRNLVIACLTSAKPLRSTAVPCFDSPVRA